MTYQTHKQYAISFSFIAAMLMYSYSITEIYYYVALPIVILTSKYGGLFPDIDHSWVNVRDKTVPNWLINKLIHLTGGRHRSWQTHSIDIVVVFSILTYLVPMVLYEYGKVNLVNKEILTLILMGFCAGWISHIVADMCTSAGVRLFCWNKKVTVKLVPRRIGRLRFNTGNEWENFVYKVVRGINCLLGAICLIYPYIVNGEILDLIPINRLLGG